MCGDTLKTIVLPFEININNPGSGSATLSLPPLPVGVDEIVIQQVNIYSVAALSNLYFLWTDLVNDNICSIACNDASTQTDCNIVIPIAPRPLPSTVTFQIREIQNDYSFQATPDQLYISVTLAFKKKCNHQ